MEIAQILISLATLIFLIWYTLETKRLRIATEEQLRLAKGSVDRDATERVRASEPIFEFHVGNSIRPGGQAPTWTIHFTLTNFGGPVSEIEMSDKNVHLDHTTFLGKNSNSGGRINAMQSFPFDLSYTTDLGHRGKRSFECIIVGNAISITNVVGG